MSTTAPDAPNGAPNQKRREDDARGSPRGSWGNPPHQPTEAYREEVRKLAKVYSPYMAQRAIARKLGISRDTLLNYYRDDLDAGRDEMLAAVGAQMVNRALDASNPTIKGDIQAQMFILARLGGWTTRVDMTPNPTPQQSQLIDISHLSLEEQAALLPIIDQLLLTNGTGDDDSET